MSYFGDRLQYLMDRKNFSQKHIADHFGHHRSIIGKWLSYREQKPRAETIQKLAYFFECDATWLATGEGEPFPPYDEPTSGLSRINSGMKQKTLEESETREPENKMVRMYRELAEMDADTLGEIQTWLNDMERMRPGFTGWFRLEFQNRFPEFDEWKMKVIKKQQCG